MYNNIIAPQNEANISICGSYHAILRGDESIFVSRISSGPQNGCFRQLPRRRNPREAANGCWEYSCQASTPASSFRCVSWFSLLGDKHAEVRDPLLLHGFQKTDDLLEVHVLGLHVEFQAVDPQCVWGHKRESGWAGGGRRRCAGDRVDSCSGGDQGREILDGVDSTSLGDLICLRNHLWELSIHICNQLGPLSQVVCVVISNGSILLQRHKVEFVIG